MSIDRARLEDLFGGDELAWLRDRIRGRVRRGLPATGTATLANPSVEQRASIDRLLGRRPSSGSRVTVRLDDLDRMLREAEVCDGLRAAMEILDGPIVDTAEDRRAAAVAWAAVLDPADPRDPPWRGSWREDLVATGLLRRLCAGPASARSLLDRAETVMAAMPAGGISRAQFAAATLHDSHALDDRWPVATVVLKALQHQHLPPEERGPLPTGVDRRALWAAAGVSLDELSAPVLILGLPASGGLVGDTLAAHAAAGEPARVTLRALLRHPPDLGALTGQRVWVCENPAVIAAAADRLGPSCAPLVCTEGQPSAAAQTLLRMLRTSGARLAYHGDLDRGGLRIATTIMRRFGAVPWQFDIAAYRTAPSGPPLGGPVAPVTWAPGLAEAMNDRGVAVHEEQVLDDLLADLGA